MAEGEHRGQEPDGRPELTDLPPPRPARSARRRPPINSATAARRAIIAAGIAIAASATPNGRAPAAACRGNRNPRTQTKHLDAANTGCRPGPPPAGRTTGPSDTAPQTADRGPRTQIEHLDGANARC
jgi:hypothetical protein